MDLKKALTIAGSDSSGGAGIQADLKTFHSIGVYGMSVITALTAQNTLGVNDIYEVKEDFIRAQLESVLEDISPDAIKTGMLFSAKAIKVVAETLAEFGENRLVVDPVMISTTGHKLISEDAVQTLLKDLIPMALVVTPNLDEAKALSGIMIDTPEDMKIAAERIYNLGAQIVVIKGGHLDDKTLTDVVFDGKETRMLTSKRIGREHFHGTGCTFASAVTAYLALGHNPMEAIERAKEFVTEAIRHAVPVGKGVLPVNHLWNTPDRRDLL